MNAKVEKKLTRLAFGETSEKEALALEKKTKTDPEAARLLSEYREMRSGLELLTEVPPDQLSKERLRDAILGQGLKPLPAPASSGWGWTWMPATAFTLVFGWLTIRHMNAPMARIVTPSQSSVAMAVRHDTAADALGVTLKSVHPIAGALAARAVPQTPAKHHAAHPTNSDSDAGRTAFLKNATTAADRVVAMLGVPKSIQEPEAERSSGVIPSQSNSGAKLTSVNTPMVLINPENDNSSGAQQATEVDSASNVVVGG
jgi:anti-sigma factor RsiW